jgi:hypothetical protein
MERRKRSLTPSSDKPVDVLEQQPDHEPALDPGPAGVAIERCDRTIDSIPVDLPG